MDWTIVTAHLLATYDVQIQQGHAMDMAGTWVLYIKSEASDTMRCLF